MCLARRKAIASCGGKSICDGALNRADVRESLGVTRMAAALVNIQRSTQLQQLLDVQSARDRLSTIPQKACSDTSVTRLI